MCNVLNMFDMPRYLHATLYIYVQYFHIYVCDVQIYMFDVLGVFLFYVFRLYAMSSGKRNYGNLKASETTALIGSLRWRQKSEILVVLVLLLV